MNIGFWQTYKIIVTSKDFLCNIDSFMCFFLNVIAKAFNSEVIILDKTINSHSATTALSIRVGFHDHCQEQQLSRNMSNVSLNDPNLSNPPNLELSRELRAGQTFKKEMKRPTHSTWSIVADN